MEKVETRPALPHNAVEAVEASPQTLDPTAALAKSDLQPLRECDLSPPKKKRKRDAQSNEALPHEALPCDSNGVVVKSQT